MYRKKWENSREQFFFSSLFFFSEEIFKNFRLSEIHDVSIKGIPREGRIKFLDESKEFRKPYNKKKNPNNNYKYSI